MIIKEANKHHSLWRQIASWLLARHQIRRLQVLLLGIMLILATVLVSLYFGMVLHRTGRAHVLNEIVRSRRSVIPNYIGGLRANPERIAIHIGHTNFNKLAYKREVALVKGVLVSGSDDYVPAMICCRGKTVKVKLRLKGDLVCGYGVADHLRGEKWSFRIVVKGEDTLMGMKALSIHTPAARGYVYEWLLHEAMKRDGIIALRYDFIDVTLNGKHLGIYAIEEHFEKRLIENNRRREGPIVHFSEDACIKHVGHNGRWYEDRNWLDFYSGHVDLYRPTKTLADPVLREQFLLGKNLLESFRIGKLKASEVFDCKILARYLALLDLFDARHAAKYGNLKFYYNPVTSKLEPICFDAEFVGCPSVPLHAENWYEDTFNPTYLFFKDMYIFKLYLQELVRISEPLYLDDLFNEINKELKAKLRTVHSEYPFFCFNKNKFYANQMRIKEFFDNPIFINAYFLRYSEEAGEKFIELHIGNIKTVPTEIISVSLSDYIPFHTGTTGSTIEPSLPRQAINIKKVRFLLPPDFEWKGEYASQLKVNYTLLGSRNLKSQSVVPWPDFDKDFIENDFVRQAANVNDFDFLVVNEAEKIIYIKPGDWKQDKNLIIPKGYKVVCGKDTRLDLSNSAKILSYSPLIFIGSEDKPIILGSEDSSGQGIVVINAQQKTVFKHVVFDNLSSPFHRGWQLTGAVTFYESDVQIFRCHFSNNKSEDALNLVRSEFSINKSLFSKTFSDAIDVDFSIGQIANSSFIDLGNDAIDVSGSDVKL